jgi:hypothetical protein
VNETNRDPLAALVATGVARTALVVTEVEAADANELVLLPVGVTMNVYPVVVASPVTVQF